MGRATRSMPPWSTPPWSMPPRSMPPWSMPPRSMPPRTRGRAPGATGHGPGTAQAVIHWHYPFPLPTGFPPPAFDLLDGLGGALDLLDGGALDLLGLLDGGALDLLDLLDGGGKSPGSGKSPESNHSSKKQRPQSAQDRQVEVSGYLGTLENGQKNSPPPRSSSGRGGEMNRSIFVVGFPRMRLRM